ncbi:hypothetical protein FQN60_015981 [Etheostoma spectabile]|uniref:BRO1 domain-containing protein BROX n=1 Tax=Etheostoma spectabile TaxID=54343 RepID=A0A5J5CSL2_9PERO|nr:hypothetical protein FQN60_015981 [Etheostoma spectabile]
MAHWFHRNPLKATAPVSFNFYGVAGSPAANKICNDLRTTRARLLEMFTDENKMRFIQNFKWTDTLQGNVPSVSEAEAKDVHRSLKVAAGIFKTLKEAHIPRLITPAEKGRDLEPRAIDAAIELKHNATLIAALAFETANFYQKAGYSRAEALCKEYRQTKGPGTTAKPSEQLFFLKLGGLIKNTLEKCQRENGFIYFHKVPVEPPQLELKASYGLAEPVPFELPPLSEQCTAEAKPKEEEVKPMKEPDLKPQKDTGCVLS